MLGHLACVGVGAWVHTHDSSFKVIIFIIQPLILQLTR